VILQEISDTVFKDFEDRLRGMVGVYANKITEQKFGSAVFVKQSRFQIRHSIVLDLTQSWRDLEYTQDMCKADPLFEKKMQQTTTAAQVLLLRDLTRGSYTADIRQIDPKCDICLVNVHLYSNPHAPHIRILQTASIIHEAHKNFGPSVPLLYGGDFNSSSDSGSCDLLRHSKIPINYFEWAEGSIFKDIRSESQDDREDNWHKVMTQKNVIQTRRIFSQLSTKRTYLYRPINFQTSP